MSSSQPPLPEASAKRRRRLGCVIAISTFTVFLGVYAWMFFSDVGPVDDSDLRFPRAPAVHDEENAAYWWGVAMEDLDSTILEEFWHNLLDGDLALTLDGLTEEDLAAWKEVGRSTWDGIHDEMGDDARAFMDKVTAARDSCAG